MRTELIVTLAAGKEYVIEPKTGVLPPYEARQWLDQQFVALDCEPLRASGKVLLADKALVVAATAGGRLLEDPEWSSSFAQAVLAALGKPLVHINVPAQEINY